MPAAVLAGIFELYFPFLISMFSAEVAGMKKFRIIHHYDIGIELFEEICFNPYPEDQANLENLEHLKTRDEFENIDDGRYIRSRARVTAVANLPAAVRVFVKPEMLGWIEEAVFDKQQHFWEWNILPYHFREHITCRGRMALVPRDGGMTRVTEGYVDLRFPVLGDLMEIFVVDGLKKSLDHEYILFKDCIQRRLDRKNSCNK